MKQDNLRKYIDHNFNTERSVQEAFDEVLLSAPNGYREAVRKTLNIYTNTLINSLANIQERNKGND